MRLLLVGVIDVVNGRFSKMKVFNQIKILGKETLETVKNKAKISTIFDIYTKKVIPTFISEKKLKEYYERKMEKVNEFIYKL